MLAQDEQLRGEPVKARPSIVLRTAAIYLFAPSLLVFV